MNILLISQCSKNALTETRRILDHFAERKGDRTWQTAITQQGLITLRQMLKRTAKKNTAVACHWIKSSNCSELLWIVGNMKEFNENGTVPTNITARDILRVKDENQWNTVEDIAIISGIAGLFHDFGKANDLFQNKLKTPLKAAQEPYRHEWISLRLFQIFVKGLSDEQWLEKLENVSDEDEKALTQQNWPKQYDDANPFKDLITPLAQVIGWIIVSHHSLPKFNGGDHSPKIDNIQAWLKKEFAASWNSRQCLKEKFDDSDYKKVWSFKHGTPMNSPTWREKAKSLAIRGLRRIRSQRAFVPFWLTEDGFTSHLARLSMMLADHLYSASEPQQKWQSKICKTYANTDKKNFQLKQKLDEHNIGVAHYAFLFSKSLPQLRQILPNITRHKEFKKRSVQEKYRWQDWAYELACLVRDRSQEQGFFGINMASTGCGKTFANARIMYGLSDEKKGCRFSVALGLRSLTLQTGSALQEKLNLSSDDIAIVTGSAAVKELYERNKIKNEQEIDSGSESENKLFSEHQYVSYDGCLDDSFLGNWLKKRSDKLHKIISAPVLISTIDHLILATEGIRGGHQIAPMLRLLTSDLVLDEPDDFELEDLPALCRLVNFAGMLGSRVLISSATLPPDLIQALFEAYLSGRTSYDRACGAPKAETRICCAWFDEYTRPFQSDHSSLDSFIKVHESFITKRVHKIESSPVLRMAKLAEIPQLELKNKAKAICTLKTMISKHVYPLHFDHHQIHQSTQKRVSIGLIRMANINHMVAVAKQFIAESPPEDIRVHFCIYHSRHPLLVRSKIEEELDSVLSRQNPEMLWQRRSIKNAITKYKETNQIFIVFATAVAEVGRDHDYDWIIAEPSSVRSLIQLAGRLQRHRQIVPKTENMLILSKNYRCLIRENFSYYQPGFESSHFRLISKDLKRNMEEHEYKIIRSTPRIRKNIELQPEKRFIDLEHTHLHEKLFGTYGKIAFHASLWWKENVSWCGEIQRETPFRKSQPENTYIIRLDEDNPEEFSMHLMPSGASKNKDTFDFKDTVICAEGMQPWLDNDICSVMTSYAEESNLSLNDVSYRYTEIKLQEMEHEKWCYHKWFGFYRRIES